jgi:hypothetical protein
MQPENTGKIAYINKGLGFISQFSRYEIGGTIPALGP